MGTTQDDISQLAQDAYGAIARRDVEWLQAHTHPDVLFQQGGRFPTAGTFHGRDAMFGHFMEFMVMVEDAFTFEVHDILTSAERVAAYLSVTIAYKGHTLTFDEVHLWRVADGMLAELHAIPFDPYAIDQFFARHGAA